MWLSYISGYGLINLISNYAWEDDIKILLSELNSVKWFLIQTTSRQAIFYIMSIL